jgi:hypothetical protein
LAEEVTRVGGPTVGDLRTARGGVQLQGGWDAVMRLNLQCRLSQRVLLQLSHGPYRGEDDIYAAAAAVRPIPSAGPTVKDTAGERLPSISLIADLVRSGLAERDLPRPLPVPPPDRAARHSQVITTEDRAGSRRPQVLLLGGLLLVAILVVTMLALSGRR